MEFDGRQFYNYNEITDDMIFEVMKDVKIVSTRKRHYLNCPVSFDTETTSFITPDDKKHAILYLWQMDLNGLCFYGRNVESFVECVERLRKVLCLDSELYMIIYVQNLAFEFQFIRKWFEWENVFARKQRKPMKCDFPGIEFRCSYMLSGYSLNKIAQNLHSHKIRKLTEQMDYTLIRTPDTVLTEQEYQYALNDVVILEYFISEEIERNGGIHKVPLTNTGYVRRYCKEKCLPPGKQGRRERAEYKKQVHPLTMNMEEYQSMKWTFAGGFTHANAKYVKKTLQNVTSFDFTSSYPAVMLMEKYPMGKGMKVQINSREELERYTSSYCCIFQVNFRELSLRPDVYECPLSRSKCFNYNVESVISNNGRVYYAPFISTWLTDVDWQYISCYYEWDAIGFGEVWVYPRQYLPTPFVDAILTLYEDKTRLKGVDGMEVEYMHSKGQLNSAYGMTVTDILPDEVIYNSALGEWDSVLPDSENLERYNNKKDRFLFYPWGIFVTAYARRNLFTGIYACGEDYVYSDTDSIKILNADKHMDYINRYNEIVVDKLKIAMKYHGFSMDRCSPKDIKDRVRTIGVWDFDGKYDEFRTLGAKRYMTRSGDKYTLTVAGTSKSGAMAYFLKSASEQNCSPFDLFTETAVIPEQYSGRQISEYIDDSEVMTITDYQGNTGSYESRSGICLYPAEYSFSMDEQFIKFLAGYQDEDGGFLT